MKEAAKKAASIGRSHPAAAAAFFANECVMTVVTREQREDEKSLAGLALRVLIESRSDFVAEVAEHYAALVNTRVRAHYLRLAVKCGCTEAVKAICKIDLIQRILAHKRGRGFSTCHSTQIRRSPHSSAATKEST